MPPPGTRVILVVVTAVVVHALPVVHVHAVGVVVAVVVAHVVLLVRAAVLQVVDVHGLVAVLVGAGVILHQHVLVGHIGVVAVNVHILRIFRFGAVLVPNGQRLLVGNGLA